MSKFTVTTGNLKASADDLEQLRGSLNEIRRQMDSIAGSNVLQSHSSLVAVANHLKQISVNIENNTVSLKNMQSTLQEIARLYEDTERQIVGLSTSPASTSETSSFWERLQQQIKDLEKMARDYLKGSLDKYCMFAGDPVNMSNGNYFLETRDLIVRGFTPIIWERNYNGLEHSLSALGLGWRHSHQWQVSRSENGWILTAPDGSVLFFEKITENIGEETGDGEFEATSGEPCRLVARDGKIEVTRNRTTLLFGLDGRIVEQSRIPGGRIRYRYDEDRLMVLEGENGTFLRLFYDRAGLLTDVSASDGGYFHYEYDNGCLIKAHSAGSYSEYGYDEAGRLEEIRGADGKTQLHNIYDSKDRVEEQLLSGGGTLRYEYLKDRTVLAWPDGTQVTYIFDNMYRHSRTVYYDSEESCTYNSRNQKTSFTDRLGRTTRYGYDSVGNLTFVIDPAGSRTSVTYDGQGRVTAVKRPDGGRTVWHYTSDGLVSERIDASGGITRYSYNNEKLPATVCFPDGTQLVIEYDSQGNMISCDADGVRIVSAEYDDGNRRILESNGEGDTWYYSYDDAGRIICVTDPRGNQQHYEYDTHGRINRYTDCAGNVSTCEYNDIGKPVLQTDVCGNVTKFFYDARFNLKEKHLPGGGVFTYAYDNDNRLRKVLRDGAAYREYEYDTVGNLTCERDALNQETRYTYDVCDRVVRISRVDGTERTFDYDECGRMTRETDYEGGETLFEYDLAGNLTARTDPAGGRTEWHYNAAGLAVQITEATGREIRLTYGSLGRVRSVDIAGGRSEEYSYDSCGRLVKECHSDGYERSYTYDGCGNLTAIRDGAGNCRTARFDEMGRVIELTDPRGNSTTYSYRPDGIMKGILDPAGSSTSYLYTPEGFLEKIVRKGRAFIADTGRTEEQEIAIVYERDHLGRLLSEADPLGNKITYAYDATDRVISRTDRMGRRTLIEYDSQGNMRELTFADGRSVRMDYTPGRQLAGIEDPAGRMRIVRDVADKSVQVIGFDETQTMFYYKEQGQLASVLYPDKAGVQYSYDRYGRPAQMCCGSLALSFAYDEAGRLVSRIDGNGDGTAWEYSPGGNVVKISCLQHGEVFKTCGYTYDACGNKTKVNWEYAGMPERGIHYSYAYDALNRIYEVYEEGTRVRRYTYDGFGNRICLEEKEAITEYQYNKANQLVLSRYKRVGEEEWKNTEYQYDPEGNQICVSGPDGLRRTRYDYLNHPVATDTETNSVRRLYSSLGQLLATAQWSHGATVSKEHPQESAFTAGGRAFENVFSMDERILEAAGISRMYYLNDYGASGDRNALLALKQSDGSLMKYVQDPFGMRTAWMDADGSVQLIWTDELGSICAVAGKDGQIADVDWYDEFGNAQDYSKGQLSGEGELSDGLFHCFAGLLPDPAGGTYTSGARLYNPLTGRFTAEDPMMRETFGVQDQNLYTYCFHQPMTLVDRDGCFPGLSDMYQRMMNFGNGVKDTWSRGVSTVKDTWNRGVSTVKDTWNWGVSTARDTMNWGVSTVKETWNRGVQRVQYIGEQASILYRLYTDPEYHYNRNQYNETPSDLTTVYEYDKNGELKGKNGWELLPMSMSKYHLKTNGAQGEEAKNNKKFVKVNPDGSSSEVIICFPGNGREPYLVDDYLNGGTFNYHNPGGWFNGNISHFLFDMMPYYLYGNQREDGGFRKWVQDGFDRVWQNFAPDSNRQVSCAF